MNDESVLIRIVDDDDDVRSALSAMLECEGFDVKSFADGESLLNSLDRERPGCVLLDVRMPGLSGPDVQAALLEKHVALPVIFLTSYAEIDVAVTTLKRGAEDFLIKPVAPDRLLAVVREVLAADAKRRAATSAEAALSAALARLTERPRTVLRLMLQHLNDAAIAERLGLSERTVQVYRQQVYKAFDVHSLKAFERLAPEIEKLPDI